MIRIYSPLLVVSFIALFTSYNAQNSSSAKSYYADTTVFKIDTTINNILIDGKHFSVTVLRDKFDEHFDEFSTEKESSYAQSPITLVFTNNADGKVVYLKKFDSKPNDYPYLQYSFYKGQAQHLNDNGRLYFMLNKSYGGSGSQSIRYFINFKNNKINFSELCSSSEELSYIFYNKNDQEIIVLDGIWNTKENESHFANHRYSITKYTYSNNNFDKKLIGETTFKYSGLDDNKPFEQILIDIKTKEPLLFKDINVADYK
jgi:hypothetical protein